MFLYSLVFFPLAVATLIPRELLFSSQKYTNVKLSPNGTYVAYIASDQNKVKNVFVKCTKCKNARQVTFEKSNDVHGEVSIDSFINIPFVLAKIVKWGNIALRIEPHACVALPDIH
ncbi:hypothetical protein COOONC_26527 [Cooperia oncophora]